MKILGVFIIAFASAAYADQACPDIYRCSAFDNEYAVEADGFSVQDAQEDAVAQFAETKNPQNVKVVCRRVERYFAWAGCFER